MSPLPAIAAIFLGLSISVALAAPPIPSSEMPGRERDRFTESPVERFMRGGSYQPPPVITFAPQGCTPRKQHSKPPAKTGKSC